MRTGVDWETVASETCAFLDGVSSSGIAAGAEAAGLGAGGLQIPQGPYRFAASISGIGMLLLARDRHEARWYFVPVRVT
jgi:hypothetical protein